MYGYIYKITCIKNKLIYIGKHKYNKPELDKTYFASGKLINQAYEKYGKNAFVQELLDIALSENELNKKEQEYISKFYKNGVPDFSIGYNLSPGGETTNLNSGKIYIHNELHNKMIYPHELDTYLSKGYMLGMLPMSEEAIENNKLAQKSRQAKWMNNGSINKCVNQLEIEKYLKNGWKFGIIRRSYYKSGNPMYNHNHSKESRKKMSKNKVGKYTGENCHRSKPCMCIETGQKFVSISEATNWLKLKTGHRGKILMVCNGDRKMTCGYHFKYI